MCLHVKHMCLGQAFHMCNFTGDFSHVKLHMRLWTREISHVKFHMRLFTCEISHVKCHMWDVTCDFSFVQFCNANFHLVGGETCEICYMTFHLWIFTCENFTWDISHVTFHMWNFTCEKSWMTDLNFLLSNFTCYFLRQIAPVKFTCEVNCTSVISYGMMA